MSNELYEQCEELLAQHLGLHIAPTTKKDVIQILGKIEVDATYKDVQLSGDFDIRIEIPVAFPKVLPSLFEESNKIPSTFEHKYLDGSCCLGIDVEILEKLSEQPNLLYFVNEFVIDYLFSVLWYKRFGIYPFGERPHDIFGKIDYYKEFWDINDENLAIKLLYIALTPGKYKGHLSCPCGSGIVGKRCHGKQFRKIFFSQYKDYYFNDCIELCDYLIKKGGKNNGKKNSSTTRKGIY